MYISLTNQWEFETNILLREYLTGIVNVVMTQIRSVSSVRGCAVGPAYAGSAPAVVLHLKIKLRTLAFKMR